MDTSKPLVALTLLPTDIEAYPYPDRGARVQRHVQAYPAATHSFEFDLDCDSDTSELRIGFGCAPGMLEIEEISLEYDGDQSLVRTYRPAALHSMLRVIYHGAAIYTGRAYWLFTCALPVLLGFRYWKDKDGRPPRKLRLKLCNHRRKLEEKFLHPLVLQAIMLEQRESEKLRQELEANKRSREMLLEHVTYAIGSKIDFSNTGNAALFMRKGWSQSEAWGTWTEGCEAVLRIRFAEAPRSDLRMNACLRTYVPAGHAGLKVNVRVNGKHAGAWTVTNRTFATLCSDIDLASLHGAECEIAFEIENPISPRQAGVSNDPRLLGLGFKSIDLNLLHAGEPELAHSRGGIDDRSPASRN